MTTLERIEYWNDLVDRWEIEGSSRKAFCEQHDIGYPSFLSWCKRLRPDGSAADQSNTLTCVEVTSHGEPEVDDEDLVLESAAITFAGSEAQITVKGRMTVASLRRIALACGAARVPS